MQPRHRSLGLAGGRYCFLSHFDDAIARHRQMGARPFLARTQLHYAEMLLERGGPRDHERARSLLAASHRDAEWLGMTAVASQAASR